MAYFTVGHWEWICSENIKSWVTLNKILDTCIHSLPVSCFLFISLLHRKLVPHLFKDPTTWKFCKSMNDKCKGRQAGIVTVIFTVYQSEKSQICSWYNLWLLWEKRGLKFSMCIEAVGEDAQVGLSWSKSEKYLIAL